MGVPVRKGHTKMIIQLRSLALLTGSFSEVCPCEPWQLQLLGGVGHCYAWHVRVPFGNVLFLISSNQWFVHVIQKTLKKGKISCLFSHPFHLFFSYPSFLTIYSPIHPIVFLSFFRFKLLHTLPIVASCLCILTVSW